MGLLSSISTAFDDGSRDEEAVFSYRCASCDTEFERSKTRMVGVRCPDCRSMDVRVANDT